MNATSNMTAADLVLHDVRAIHDAAALPDSVEPWADPVMGSEWLVMRIVPDPGSGTGMYAGTAIDIDTGGFVDSATGEPVESNGPLVTVKSGRWEVAAAPSRQGPRPEGVYGWGAPVGRIRKIEAEDLYSPFEKGGVALTRHSPGEEGPAEFDPLYLLPPPWVYEIHQAYELAAQEPRPLAAQETPEIRVALGQFALGANSVLATLAYRRLLEWGVRDARVINAMLFGPQGFRRAVNLYLAATAPVSEGEETLQAQITGAVTQSMPPDELRLTAAALAAVSLLRRDIGSKRPWLETAATSLRGRIGADEYLGEAYALLGNP